jgi:phage-related baseplate assembly protein
MSRNTEYAFFSTDPAEVESKLTELYYEATGVTPAPASPEKLFIKWVASIIVYERAKENYAINQNIPSRAEGENLDALAELFFAQEREKAGSATCTVRFSISEAQESAVKVPAGTRVTDEGKSLYWETAEDAYIQPGETYVDLTVKCQTAGTVGNGWSAGQLNKLVDLYDYCSGISNLTESDGGTDEMTDDELYEAMRLSMDALSTAGAMGSYIYHAKAVSTEIADVAVSSPSPGVVRIYALMEGGEAAGEEMKGKILSACNAETVRPLTDQVEMGDPEEVPYDIELTYYLPSGANSGGEDLEKAVEEAVEEYVTWQSGKLGRDINPSRLLSLVMATGVKRVELASPAYTQLRDGKTALEQEELDEEQTIPQVAKLGSVTLRNGGTEDE